MKRYEHVADCYLLQQADGFSLSSVCTVMEKLNSIPIFIQLNHRYNMTKEGSTVELNQMKTI